MRKHVKQALSLVLSLAMAVSLIPGNTVSAKETKKDESKAKIQQYLRSAVSDKKYPNGAFGIGETQLRVKEGKKQTITIVRQGNTDKKQKVRFKAVDVSAVYGQDYTLTVKHSFFKKEQLKGPEDSKTLLEGDVELGEDALSYSQDVKLSDQETGQKTDTDKAEASGEEKSRKTDAKAAAKAGKKSADVSAAADKADADNATASALTGEEADAQSDTDEEDAGEAADFPEAEESSLKNAYAVQNDGDEITQSDWKAVNPKDVSKEDKEDLAKGDKQVKKSLAKLDGAETVLTFGKGEYMKEIVLTSLDDDKSESDEQVAFFLFPEDGSKVGNHDSGYVNIKDNDGTEEVTFAVKKKSVNVAVNEDRAKVTIVRKSGIDQIAVVKAGTKAITAEPGKDYEVTTEDIFFAPGVKEKDFYVPITGDRGKVKEFYVGIMQNGEVTEKDGQAAVVTICKREKSGKNGDVSLSAQSQTIVKTTGNTDWYSGSDWSWRICRDVDMRLATKVTATYDIEGQYTEKSGCDTVTRYNKTAYIALAGWSDNVVEEQSKFFNGQNSYTGQTIEFKRELKDVDKWSALGGTGGEIMAKVSGTNAKIRVTKMEIEFADYTLILNHGSGSAHHKEEQYTGYVNGKAVKSRINNDSDETDELGIRLGTAYFGDKQNNLKKSLAAGDSTDLHYVFSGRKNSQGVVADGDSVEFKGYYASKPNSSTMEHSGLITASEISTISYDFVHKYKDYLYTSDNTFELYPVFAPKSVKIKCNNSDANRGSFLNFSSQSQEFSLTRMDSIKIDAAAKPGNGITEMQLFNNNGVVSNKDTALTTSLETGLGNTAKKKMPLGDYQLRIFYETSKIKVMYDPAYAADTNLKQKGAVYYTEKDSDGKIKIVAQADKDTNYQFELNNVTMDKTYNLIGITEQKSDTTTYWRDGNTDADEDGIFEEKVGNYKVFTPVLGNILPLVVKNALSRVYYSVQPHGTVKLPQPVIGRLWIRDEAILTGKVIEKGVNGANINCEGVQTLTEHGAYSSKQEKKDGFFRIDHPSFGANDYRLVNAQADYGEDGSFNASFVANPAIMKDCVIDASKEVTVDDPHVYSKNGSKWDELTVTSDQDGYYSSLSNANKTYKISLHASKTGTFIKKATMKFYDIDGREIPDKKVEGKEVNASANTGIFEFELNPSDKDKDNGLSLPAGTTIKVNFIDSNNNISLQRELGLMFVQAVGPMDLLNSFDFGGANAALDLVGKIDGAFNLGWSGDFDDKAEDVTDETGKTTGEKRVSYGFSKEVINKGTKEKNPVMDAADGLGKAEQSVVDAERAFIEIQNKKADGTWDDKEDGNYDERVKDARKKMTDAMDTRDQKKKDFEKASEDAVSAEKSNTKVTANVKLELGVSFVMTFGQEKGRVYFEDMMVTATVKGGFEVNIEYATPVGVTIYVKFTAGVEEAGASFVVEARKDRANSDYYLTDMVTDENNHRLNIFDVNPNKADRKFNGYGKFVVNPYIGIEAGAGALGCTVTLGGRATFKMTFYTNSLQDTGSVNLTASLKVKVLLFEYEWEFANKDFQLFGSKASALDAMEGKNYLYQSAELLKPQDTDYMKGGTNWQDAGISAQSLDESEKSYAEKQIGNKIKENPSFKMITLDDTKGSEKYLAVFLNTGDESRDDLNNQAAYYVYYENGEWGTPVMIEDDGTFDQDVAVFSLGKRGAIITWATSPEKYTADMDKTTQQNKLDLHAAFVGMDGKISGEIQKVTHETKVAGISDYNDYAADAEANVSYDETSGRMVIYYQKREYNYTGAEMIGDVIYPQYALMSARYYDFKDADGFDGDWISDYTGDLANDIKEEIKDKIAEEIKAGTTEAGTDRADVEKRYQAYVEGFYGQEFFEYLPSMNVDETLDELGYWTEEPTVTNLDNTKASVVDSDAFTADGQGVFAYTVDKDGDYKTLGDRDVVLQVYDFEKQIFTHPVVLTSDNVEDANVRFVQIDRGTDAKEKPVYLAWLHNGDIVGMNISYILKNKDKMLRKYDRDGNGKADAYYLDKTAPASAEDQTVTYIPPMTYVKGEVADEDGAKSEITGFDVRASKDYAYFVWTQNGTSLEDGIEEGSEEAADPSKNQPNEQMYTARYDLENGDMTYPVQVTSKFGTHYRDVAFAVEGEDLVGLVYKAGSRELTWEEFSESVKAYNQEVEKQAEANATDIVENGEKADELSKEDYTPYYVADIENAKSVTFRLNPLGEVKIKNAGFVEVMSTGENGTDDKKDADSEEEEETTEEEGSSSVVTAGHTATLKFDVLNDGVGTAKDLTLTAKDEDGNSVLAETTSKESEDGTAVEAETKSVDQIKIDKMLGGASEAQTCYVDIPEDAISSTVTIQIKDQEGNVVAEEKVTKELESSLSIDNLTIESTDKRNEYVVSGDVENTGTAKAEAGKLEIGARKATDGSAPAGAGEETEDETEEAEEKEYTYSKYADVSHEALLPGEKTSFSETVTIDPEKDFVTETNENGDVTESGEIYVKAGDTIGTDIITRETESLAASWVQAIKEIGVTGAENDTVNAAVGETIVLSPEVISDLADAENGITGMEGLQFRFEAEDEDEDVASVNYNGVVTGEKVGTTKVKMYAFAKDHEFVTAPDVGSEMVDGVETSSYLTSPESLIFSKEITINVSEAGEKPADPAAVSPEPAGPPAPAAAPTSAAVTTPAGVQALKTGATFTSGSLKYKVISAKSKTIAVNAGKNKNLTKVTIPATVKKNGTTYKVISIGAKAFKGYKKLKSVTIGTNITKIGKQAFMNCAKLKTITVKTTKLTGIGKNAFTGIKKNAIFKVSVAKTKKKTVQKKLKKLLTGKTGFQKKTMKIK